MIAKLTDEQRDALQNQPPGEPLPLVDDQTQRVYFLLDRDAAREFAVYTLRRELQSAFEQAERGELDSWDVDEIIAEGERGLQPRDPET